MVPELRRLLLEYADDELILGHRHSEWTAFAPTIEEDVALASIAQDELAHARLLLELLADEPEAVNRLAYLRGPQERWNARLLEAPNRDFAFTIARQLAYDWADDVRTGALAEARHDGLSDRIRLMRREERFHLEHGEAWLKRLLHGTEESRRRMEEALRAVLPEAIGVLSSTAWDPLYDMGFLPCRSAELRRRFTETLQEHLGRFGLAIELPSEVDEPGRHGVHGEALTSLLEDLTAVLQSDPQARW